MFTLELEVEGLDEMQKQLETLHWWGSNIGGAELRNIPRTMSQGKKNAEILQELEKSGRDFITSDDVDLIEIEEGFADSFELEWTTWSKIANIGDTKKAAQNAAAKCMREAMRKYMGQVKERIESQSSNTGDIADLKPHYKKWKEREVGFIYPIGKLYGELLENLDPDGPATERIRFTKS